MYNMFGIFDSISRELLGKWGRNLLDFVLANSYIICPIVVFYGAILIFAQRNMEKIAKKAETLENGSNLYQNDPTSAFTAKESEYWEQLREVSGFPFISLPSSFRLYRSTPKNISSLIVPFIAIKQKMKRSQKRS